MTEPYYAPEYAEGYPTWFALGCKGKENVGGLFAAFLAWWHANNCPNLRTLRFEADNDFNGPAQDKWVLIARPLKG